VFVCTPFKLLSSYGVYMYVDDNEGSKYRYDMGYLIGFAVTLAVLVIETIVLLQNVERIRIASPLDVLYNPLKAAIYGTYIVSLFAIPAFISWTADVSVNVIKLYRRYVVMSLQNVNEKSVRKRVNVILITLPIALLLVFFSIQYRVACLALAPMVPLVLFVAMLLKPILDVSAHNKSVDVELKWFIILLLSVEYVKAGLHYMIEKLSKINLLPAISKELKIIQRDTLVYFTSYVEAFIQRAKITPSQRLKRILLGYSMRMRSGGDTVTWLKTILNEELAKEEWLLRNYSERIATTVLQISTAIFVLLPTLVIAMPVMSPDMAIAASVLGVPILSLLAYTTRPRKLDRVELRYIVMPLLLMVISIPLLYFMLGSQGVVLSWIIATIFSINGYRVLNEIKELDLAALEMLKNVAELRKYGLEIPKALKFVAQSRTLGPSAQKRINKLIDFIDSGYTFEEAVNRLKTPSHIFNFVILYLALLHECGGGDEEVIQMTYEYLYRFKTQEELLKRSSLIFDLFAMANLFILVWIWRSVKPLILQWHNLPYTPPIAISGNIIGLIMVISMLSYSLVSSIVRNGLPIFELPREVYKALLTLAAMAML